MLVASETNRVGPMFFLMHFLAVLGSCAQMQGNAVRLPGKSVPQRVIAIPCHQRTWNLTRGPLKEKWSSRTPLSGSMLIGGVNGKPIGWFGCSTGAFLHGKRKQWDTFQAGLTEDELRRASGHFGARLGGKWGPGSHFGAVSNEGDPQFLLVVVFFGLVSPLHSLKKKFFNRHPGLKPSCSVGEIATWRLLGVGSRVACGWQIQLAN